MKLSTIKEEFRALEELYEGQIDYETGELLETEVLEELQEELKQQLVQKSEGIIHVIKNKEYQLDVIDNEIKRLQTIKKVRSNQLKNFENFIKTNMIQMELQKVETPLGNLSLRKSKSVELNEDVLDSKYGTIVQETKFSKTDIKKLLEAGEVIQGAIIVENISLQVK